MRPEIIGWRAHLREVISDLTPGVTICILFLIFVAIVGLFAPWIAPFDEGQILTNESFEPRHLYCGWAAIILGAICYRV